MQRKRGLEVVEAEAPEIEVDEKPERRRRYPAAYKARILREAEAAPHGGIAAMLRREGLYKSTLAKWRYEARKREKALKPKKRGPKENAESAELQRLKRANARLEKQLRQANALIDLQKKWPR
jgi:transposase